MRKLILTAALLAGCSTVVDPLVNDSLFLVQVVRPGIGMDALFEGVVTVDAAGCYRLGDSRVTMVWPFGYRMIDTIEGPAVADGTGGEVGRIGSSFRFGGGILSAIPEGLIGSPQRRRDAMARCPGEFWIATGQVR